MSVQTDSLLVSKSDVVRLQTTAAIDMLFSGFHPVPIHTVCAAAFRVARDLAQKNHSEIFQRLTDMIVPGNTKEFWTHVNKPVDFFKHADKDPYETFDFIDEQINDYTIFWTTALFEENKGAMTPEMKVFVRWFVVQHPDCVLDLRERKAIVAAKQTLEISCASRSEYLKLGKQILERERAQAPPS